MKQFSLVKPLKDENIISAIEKAHDTTEALLQESNKGLAGLQDHR